jgi:phospho-N-acetylmuramoyl-pentapeptide-transferase
MIAPLIAAGVAMILSLVGTGWMTRMMSSRGRTQPILAKNAANLVVPEHGHKAGTPTMGGLAIVAAALIGYLVSHMRSGVVFSNQTLIMWLGVLAMALVGFVDDAIKIRTRHNRGVLWRHKGYITLAIAIGIAAILLATTDIDTRLSFVRPEVPGWNLGNFVWLLWAGSIIFATSNAVNVTDGLDGLAAGSALLGFVAFTGIAFLAFRNPTIYPSVVNPYDLAVFAASFAGGCAGFLWWNAAPADIFMGDVGALAIGTALALLGLTTDTHLLLILICGLNVMEIGSVALQMLVFRASGRKLRLFRLSPIHHHFELGGWPETKVIIRFWLIAGISVATALAIFIADFSEQAARP